MAAAIMEETDVDALEPEDRDIAARRLKAYSIQAIQIASEIDRAYVKHTKFAQAIEGMDRVFQLAREFEMAHGIKLVGPPGSGKTALFRYFRDSLPKTSLFAHGFGAIGIRASRNPTAGQLVAALLRAYRYPFRAGAATIYGRSTIVLDLIQEKGTRLIFVDEAQHLLKQLRKRESHDEEPAATDYLRELMDTGRVALVLAGTSLLDRLHGVDPHLHDRVSGRFELEHFAYGPQWRGFLRALIKQSRRIDIIAIDGDQEAKRLHAATGGNPRSLKRILTEAVLIAADAHQTAVTPELLGKAFGLVNGASSLKVNPYEQQTSG